MSLRDMVKSYSNAPATAKVAIPATDGGLALAKVATVAVASLLNDNEKLTEHWQWFLSLATEHGIHSDVVGAEFASEQDRLDVIEQPAHEDKLRACMTTLCNDERVRRRQQDYEAGIWIPVNPDGTLRN